MKKILLSFISLLMISFMANSQSVTINPATLSTTQLNGLGSSNYHVSEYIYTDAEIGNTNFTSVATALNQINLNMTATSDKPSQVFTNVKIYLKEVSAATTGFSAGTYTTAGYTEVFNGSFPASVVGFTGVILTTPFVRTAGSNLQMMIERTDNVLPFTAGAPPTWQSTIGNATGSRRYNGTAALSGTTALAVSAHRVVVQFKHGVANDATVGAIKSVGKYPVGFGGAKDIVTTITNSGTSALTNLPVTLSVTGANTYNNVQNIASLAAGASATVTFSAYTPSTVGNNVLSISVPSDGDNTNNVVTQNQVTTASTYALSNDDAFSPGGSIGFNTGSGNLLVQMPIFQTSTLSSVRVSLSTETSVAGNTVYGVLLSSTGTIIAQTPNYVVQNSDLGQYVTFTFAAPQAVTAGTTYYIGLGQTANAITGYFPVNTQSTKTNDAYSTVLAGGALTSYTTFGSLMIEGVFSTAFPVTLSSFNGIRANNINKLTWSTATEINNAGFELQRSADGVNFSALTFVASKSATGNSNIATNYSFDDIRPLISTGYYRLKQIDKDGKATLSRIVEIKGNKVSALTVSAVYPNPVKNNLNVVVAAGTNEIVTLSVVDLAGKVISVKTQQAVLGDNTISINTANLANGTYLLKVTNAKGETAIQKFVKN